MFSVTPATELLISVFNILLDTTGVEFICSSCPSGWITLVFGRLLWKGICGNFCSHYFYFIFILWQDNVIVNSKVKRWYDLYRSWSDHLMCGTVATAPPRASGVESASFAWSTTGVLMGSAGPALWCGDYLSALFMLLTLMRSGSSNSARMSSSSLALVSGASHWVSILNVKVEKDGVKGICSVGKTAGIWFVLPLGLTP